MEMVRELGQLRGVPAKIMRAPKEAQRMAQQEAQTKQGMQTVQAGVDAAKNLSQASLAGPSALSALLGHQT